LDSAALKRQSAVRSFALPKRFLPSSAFSAVARFRRAFVGDELEGERVVVAIEKDAHRFLVDRS
jgi:hypothetical protein